MLGSELTRLEYAFKLESRVRYQHGEGSPRRDRTNCTKKAIYWQIHTFVYLNQWPIFEPQVDTYETKKKIIIYQRSSSRKRNIYPMVA